MKTKNSHNLPVNTVIALILTITLLSLSGPAWSGYDQMRDEVAQFHAFMVKHPSVSTDLQANPELVNSRKYLDKHEDVKKFFKQHPAVQQEIAQHPRRVFQRYYIDDRHEYSDNRPEHRWDYKGHDRRDDRDHRDYRDRH